jgi:hypothetical protein
LAPPIGAYRQSIEIAAVPGPHRLAAGIVHFGHGRGRLPVGRALGTLATSDGELAFDAEMTLREYRAGCLNLEWG